MRKQMHKRIVKNKKKEVTNTTAKRKRKRKKKKLNKPKHLASALFRIVRLEDYNSEHFKGWLVRYGKNAYAILPIDGKMPEIIHVFNSASIKHISYLSDGYKIF